MRERAAIIVNPLAGRGRAWTKAHRFHEVLRREGVQCHLLESADAGDARRRASELGGVVDVIVSVGGDGTLNEIVNGLADAEWNTPVALLPAGTGNVVSQDLHLPPDLPSLARVVAYGPLRALDMALANGRRFVMCSGCGFDASIVRQVHAERTGRGITMMNYVLPVLRALAAYTFPPMRVYVDGLLAEERANFVVVGNMRRYGGPFRFFNEARPDDAVLDICCLRTESRLDLVRTAWAALRKRVPKLPFARYHAGKIIEVHSEVEDVPVQVDGDPHGALPVRYEILPEAVRVCVGGGGAEYA